MKKLVFDVTDAGSILDSDSVGAYLRASDGTLLTHTDVSGKKALDVNVASGVNVEVDLDHTEDSVRLGDGTTFFTSTSENGDVSLDVHISNSDLDIRDLSASQDNVAISDGSDTLAINADGSINITDNGGSITVDAVDLDIRDLSAAQDSVESHLHDGAGTALTSTLVSGDQALDVNISNTISINDAALADTAIAATKTDLAVADTAQDVIASPLASRKYLYIRNMDNRLIYIGQSGVTVTDGFPLDPEMTMMMRAGDSIDIEFIGSSGRTPEIRTLELS